MSVSASGGPKKRGKAYLLTALGKRRKEGSIRRKPKPPPGKKPSKIEALDRFKKLETMVLNGWSRPEIIRRAKIELGISERTVDRYISNIHEQLQADMLRSRPENKALAVRRLEKIAAAALDGKSYSAVVRAEEVRAKIEGTLEPLVVQHTKVQTSPAAEELLRRFDHLSRERQGQIALESSGAAPEVRPDDEGVEVDQVAPEMEGEVAEEHLVSTDGADVGVPDEGITPAGDGTPSDEGA